MLIFIFILILILIAVCIIPFLIVGYTAVKKNKSEINLLGGLVKYIVWPPNEGIIILRNKQLTFIDEQAIGGKKFIFPIRGEELAARVPLTIKMLTWEDDRILTRESLQIYMKVVIWWNVQNIKKYAFNIDESIHVNEKRDPIASLSSPETWLMALTESTIRILASRASTTQLVTSVTSGYLNVHHADGNFDANNKADAQTISETIAHQLHEDLNAKVIEYGVNINRIEIQAIRLPKEIQEAINRVWLSFLKPVQSEQETKARQIEIEGLAKSLGTDTASVIEILKNMKVPNTSTQAPLVQTILNTMDSKTNGLFNNSVSNTNLPPASN